MLRQRNTCLRAPLSLAVLGLLCLLGTGGHLPAQESASLTDTGGFGQSEEADLGDAAALEQPEWFKSVTFQLTAHEIRTRHRILQVTKRKKLRQPSLLEMLRF